MKLAPTSDDIWFWLMGVLQGYRVNVVPDNNPVLNYIPDTQDVGLYHINDVGGNERPFIRHLNAILDYYPILRDVLTIELRLYKSEKKLAAIKGSKAYQYSTKVRSLLRRFMRDKR